MEHALGDDLPRPGDNGHYTIFHLPSGRGALRPEPFIQAGAVEKHDGVRRSGVAVTGCNHGWLGLPELRVTGLHVLRSGKFLGLLLGNDGPGGQETYEGKDCFFHNGL